MLSGAIHFRGRKVCRGKTGTECMERALLANLSAPPHLGIRRPSSSHTNSISLRSKALSTFLARVLGRCFLTHELETRQPCSWGKPLGCAVHRSEQPWTCPGALFDRWCPQPFYPYLTYLTTSSGFLPLLLYLTSLKTGLFILPSHLPQTHCSWFICPCCDSGPDPLPVSHHCAQS